MEAAIGTATALFWRGYDKTSLTDLTGALGIGAASFYFAFESKEKLFREVVGRYVAALEAAYESAFPDIHNQGRGGNAPAPLRRCGDRSGAHTSCIWTAPCWLLVLAQVWMGRFGYSDLREAAFSGAAALWELDGL